MSKTTVDIRRRRALLGGAALIASIPLARVLPGARAADAELPHLTEDDPAAKALSYHQDASTAPRVDQGSVAAAEQFCHNCRFVQSDSGAWRPCMIFPGKAVNADGWCSSWVQKTG